MAGGVHANFYPEATLRDMDAQVVGVGECERTIVEIVARRVQRDFTDVSGVCFWEAGGKIVRTQANPVSRDLDWLPLPARHLLAREDVVMSQRLPGQYDCDMAHVMFSRGCPYPCRFCAVSQSQIQYRSGHSARLELEHLRSSFAIDGFAIVDDNFIVDDRRVSEICEEIQHLGLPWSALSRVDGVDHRLLGRLREAGCVEIKYGIESGSPEILRAMRKNTSIDQIRWAVRTTRESGIGVKAFIIHGFPGETKVTTHQTIALLEELRSQLDRVSLLRFVPLPGTYVFENADDFRVHGTHEQEDWIEEDWRRYNIHDNNTAWWGTPEEQQEVNESYEEIREFVNSSWPEILT